MLKSDSVSSKAIVILGLNCDNNFGDSIICECTKYLIDNNFTTSNDVCLRTKIVDLKGRSSFDSQTIRLSKGFVHQIKHRVLNSIPLSAYAFYNLLYRKRLYKFYSLAFKNADLIVFAGGSLIKYKQQNLYLYIRTAIRVAEEMNIPVIFNSVGVEGYSPKDFRCKLLQRAITRPVVKSITTRDDFISLDEGYLRDNPQVYRKKTTDVAVWASETYAVTKDNRSNVIGIGVIRGNIFQEYGFNVYERDLIQFYMDLIKELHKRGYYCELFTNGSPQDYKLIQKIKSDHGLKNIQEKVPANSRELVEIISRFKGVIAPRLHANIVSYALGIPSVGLVWNKKLERFGDHINYPERFVLPPFNALIVADKICKAMRENYATLEREAIRDMVKLSLLKQINEALN